MEPRLFLLLVLSPCALGLMVARCPEGWKSRGNTDECYKVHSYGSDRTFDDARVYCQARGGDLAFIDTKGLRDWLGQLVAATGNVGQYAYMWVGAKNVDGKWQWIENGQPVESMVVEWEGSGEGNCAALTLNSKLIKQDCGQRLKFICHRNIRVPMVCDYTIGWEDADDKCYKVSNRRINKLPEGFNDTVLANMFLDFFDQKIKSIVESFRNEELEIPVSMPTPRAKLLSFKQGHAGSFTWIDGTSSNRTYWHDGQPDK
ncbi:lymphocyte antigen 75-like [Portunus trituberculatus]|uniref:lymphocyte antigen 75-like n=1 Tax=Portunus trituberculatus TaxID=210409 RepID=UPI001E1CCB0E|nr:lymphocyte antigen 75-like [Portunus trituberculatus]